MHEELEKKLKPNLTLRQVLKFIDKNIGSNIKDTVVLLEMGIIGSLKKQSTIDINLSG
jgi:hypothetical protein